MIGIISGWLMSALHAQPQPVSRTVGDDVKSIHITANLVVNTPDELLGYVDRAQEKGANTVFYADTKLMTFGLNGTAGERWDTRIRQFVDGVKSRGMKLHFLTIVMGFNNAMLASAPDLTTGYPIKGQPLRAVGGELKPVSTASVTNGGFESYADNQPDDWAFQDAPGQRTFIDTETKRSGRAAFRADARNGESSRIFTSFQVKPFHQYTVRFWVKTQNLTADNLVLLVRDFNNKDRYLTKLRLSTAKEGGGRSYFNSPKDLSLDWTEMRIAFNSLSATEVDLGLTLFGGKSGSVWWDDFTILDTPTLNWLNRDDLPRSVVHNNGSSLAFAQDVALPDDEKLGRSSHGGTYDTHHQPPSVDIESSAKIKEGDIVNISGYHALPTQDGQVSASWNNPETYRRMRKIHQTLQQEFEPDGYLLNYSEIRTGGWEPLDTEYGTSGQALAASIQRAYQDLSEVAPDAEHYFWSDMVDTSHNAQANYYQVNNTLDGSWKGLDPKKVIIANWWEGQKITDKGPSSLKFLSDLGFKQIIGGYYDADVTDNYNRWQEAARGVDGVIGSMFATWQKNYTNIERFGDLWWNASDQEPGPSGEGDVAGKYWRLENKATAQWIRPRGCATSYGEEVPLVLTGTSNTGQCTMFEFVPTDDGYYFIQNRATQGRYRPKDCSTASNDMVEIVQVGGSSFGWCEQWKLVDAGEGYYRIQNRQTGRWIRSQGCSDVTDGSVPITQVPQSYNKECTKWKLIEAGPVASNQSQAPSAFSLYPNPARQQVDLAATGPNVSAEDIREVTLLNTQGEVIRRFDPQNFSRSSVPQLNVSGIREGIYILSVGFESGPPEKSTLVIKR